MVKKYVAELNKQYKQNSSPIIIKKNQNKIIEKTFEVPLIFGISFSKIFIIN